MPKKYLPPWVLLLSLLATLPAPVALADDVSAESEIIQPPPEVPPPTLNPTDILHLDTDGAVIEINSSLTVGGIVGNYGEIKPSNDPTPDGQTTLRINVADGESYAFSGKFNFNSSDGSNALTIIKLGQGLQEISGGLNVWGGPWALTPRLNVLEGTWVISGSLFPAMAEGWSAPQAIVVSKDAILEIRRDWNAGSYGAFGSLNHESSNILLNGGVLKFSVSGQTSERGFSVGSGGMTLQADANFLKLEPSEERFAITGWGEGGSITLDGSAGSVVIGGQPNGGSELREVLGKVGRWSASAQLIKSGGGYWKIKGSNLEGGILVRDGILTITDKSETHGPVVIQGGIFNLEHSEGAGSGIVTIDQGKLELHADDYRNSTIINQGVLDFGGHVSEAPLTIRGGWVLAGENYRGDADIWGRLKAESNLGSLGQGSLKIQSGGELTGQGKVGKVEVLDQGLLNPGNGIGSLEMASLRLQGGGKLKLEVLDPFKEPNIGHDTLRVQGELDLSQLSEAQPFRIEISSIINDSLTKQRLFALGKISMPFLEYGQLQLADQKNLTDLLVLELAPGTRENLNELLGGEIFSFSLIHDAEHHQFLLNLSVIPESTHYFLAISILAFLGISYQRSRLKVTSCSLVGV